MKMKIVFFGDSVTEGAFELLDDGCGGFINVFDKQSVYHERLLPMLKEAYPDRDFEFINEGIAGNNTDAALARIDGVVAHGADIAVVCFGLNDVHRGNLTHFIDNMRQIFTYLSQSGSKVIYMTPNMTNTYVDERLMPQLIAFADKCAACQNRGDADAHFDAVKALANEKGVIVADAYSEWKRLARYGVDTTALLCNHINHPKREMHGLFADLLLAVFRTHERELGLV